MIVLDPGHQFDLDCIGSNGIPTNEWEKETLTFVKRDGPGYPGNEGRYPGTTLQEVYRACITRHIYLDNQIPAFTNRNCIFRLRENIQDLEIRAANRHGRLNPIFQYDVENMIVCPKCLHIGCEGNCHA